MRFRELIVEDVVAAGSDILVRRPSENSFHVLHELYTEVINGLVHTYLSDDRPVRAPWRVIPATKLKSVWKTSARYGFVRQTKQLDEIANLFFNNVARLWANTEIAAHGTSSTEEVLAEYLESGDLKPEDIEGFVDWCIDTETGGWRISDYGLPKLMRLAQLLVEADTAEEKLMVCDAMLNVIHPRSDLASWFVEGGSQTLSEVSLQDIHESAAPGGQPLYHVTFTSRVPKIRREGIQAGKKRNWDRYFGGKYGDTGYVYVFTSAESAARWAHKMQYDFEKPCSVIELRGVTEAVEDDPSGEQQMMVNGKDTWKRIKGSIPASCISRVVDLSPAIIRRLVDVTSGRATSFTLTESVDYPKVLRDQELIDYAFDCAHEDECDGIDPHFLDEMFGEGVAELKRIPIRGLKFNGGVEVEYKADQYRKLSTEAPPIIVNGATKEIMDGNHRVREALARGQTDILAYVVRWEDEPL